MGLVEGRGRQVGRRPLLARRALRQPRALDVPAGRPRRHRHAQTDDKAAVAKRPERTDGATPDSVTPGSAKPETTKPHDAEPAIVEPDAVEPDATQQRANSGGVTREPAATETPAPEEP